MFHGYALKRLRVETHLQLIQQREAARVSSLLQAALRETPWKMMVTNIRCGSEYVVTRWQLIIQRQQRTDSMQRQL